MQNNSIYFDNLQSFKRSKTRFNSFVSHNLRYFESIMDKICKLSKALADIIDSLSIKPIDIIESWPVFDVPLVITPHHSHIWNNISYNTKWAIVDGDETSNQV